MDLYPDMLIYVATRTIQAGEEIIVSYNNNESKTSMSPDPVAKESTKLTSLCPPNASPTVASWCCNGPSCHRQLYVGERMFSCPTCWERGIGKDLCEMCFYTKGVREELCQHPEHRWEFYLTLPDQSE